MGRGGPQRAPSLCRRHLKRTQSKVTGKEVSRILSNFSVTRLGRSKTVHKDEGRFKEKRHFKSSKWLQGAEWGQTRY